MNKAPLIFDKAMQEARRFWRDRLEAMSFAGHIALDHPRRRDGERRISGFEHKLDSGVNALLDRLTSGNAFLRYTCLVTGLEICCSTYSGEPSVTIFCPADSQAGAPNLLPVGSVIDRTATFKTTLIATKDALAESYRRQHYPFSRMLFDIREGHRPKHLHLLAALEGFNGELPEEQTDIAALFRTLDGATVASIRFDAAAYEEATLRQFFLTFNTILRSGLRDMNLPVSELAVERACAPGGASCCASPVPAGSVSVQRRIESHAAEGPDSVAVVEGNRITTYQMLDAQSTILANVIAASGVDRRRPIAILLDASTDSIVSMFAVLKAGGSFAPIRPLGASHSMPEMLKALGCECIICRDEHLPHLREATTCLQRSITLKPGSTDSSGIVSSAWDGNPPSARPDTAAAQEPGSQKACVLLNGRAEDLLPSPIEGAELLDLFDWINSFYGIGPADRCLLAPSLGPCEQLYDTLGMLTAGASVEILDQSGARDASQLAGRLMSGAVTVWDVPTALMQNTLAEVETLCSRPERAKGPRAILLTGEKQCSILSGRLRKLFPSSRIAGLYAAPGVQLWTTVFPVGDGVAAPGDAAVAQAIRGFEHRVLNQHGEPVPLLAKGELKIGRSLAEGRAAPTTRRMRVQRLDSTRMRWLRGEDHCFLKYDCSVELTDVEAVLCRHDQIRGAEVLAVSDGREGGQLVAAFVVAPNAVLSAEAARDFLVLTAGVDLIPDRFVILEEFPLLADGSIDREVLIRRFLSSGELAVSSHCAASSEVRARLKSVWLEVLQVADVHEDDSFFTLGGNSLKATMLIARIRNEFQVELSVQSFFRQPTPGAVAELIAAETTKGMSKEAEPEFQVVPREKYRVQLSASSS